jgi:hypothetical protein
MLGKKRRLRERGCLWNPPGLIHIYSVLGYLMLPASVAGEYAPALIGVHLTF